VCFGVFLTFEYIWKLLLICCFLVNRNILVNANIQCSVATMLLIVCHLFPVIGFVHCSGWYDLLLQGMLCPDPLSRTNTLVYRLRALWRHVRRSRAAFESEPETGLIGKGFSRHLNRAWNYVAKGALGTIVLVCVSVPACLLTSLLSLLTAFLVPAW